MAEESGQTFAGGVITVGTPELNPILYHFSFYRGFDEWKIITDNGTTINQNMHIPHDVARGTLGIANAGDENIDIHAIRYLDGIEKTNKECLDMLPNLASPFCVFTEWHPSFDPLPPEYKTPGNHTISWELYAKRTTEASYPITPQVTNEVTYYIDPSPELNPVFESVCYCDIPGSEKYSFVVNNTFVPNVVVAIKPEIQTIKTHVRNDGDESINIKHEIWVDGAIRDSFSASSIGPSAAHESGTSPVSLTAGTHNTESKLWACRTTETFPATPQISVSGIFYAYTPSLDAIASTVKVIQGANEYLWLTGTADGFIASTPTIEPNIATTFKFELSNPGDEPIKMNVGHYVTDHYETGFLVGGALLDTIEKNVEIAPGATGIINTQSFTASHGSLTIGSLATLRTRHLI